MTKVSVFDYSSWKPYEGISEGSGRSEKMWLRSEDGQIGLFKFPKTDPVTHLTTYEHISEHLAFRLGQVLGVNTARIELGRYDNRIGSLSYLVNGPHEELREGAEFILGRHPKYNLETMQDEETGKFYSLENLFEVTDHELFQYFLIEMMLFDFLIGNSDRHQNNWAMLLPVEDKDKLVIRVRPCPLYDNGSSLCCYVNDTQVIQYLGKDHNRINSLIDSKSRSMIRIDGKIKRKPLHSEVVRYLLKNYPVTKKITDRFIESLNERIVIELVDVYPKELLDYSRKKLIKQFLKGKTDLLKAIRGEADNG